MFAVNASTHSTTSPIFEKNGPLKKMWQSEHQRLLAYGNLQILFWIPGVRHLIKSSKKRLYAALKCIFTIIMGDIEAYKIAVFVFWGLPKHTVEDNSSMTCIGKLPMKSPMYKSYASYFHKLYGFLNRTSRHQNV